MTSSGWSPNDWILVALEKKQTNRGHIHTHACSLPLPCDILHHLRALPARRPPPDASSQPWTSRTMNQINFVSLKTYTVCGVVLLATQNGLRLVVRSMVCTNG
jgi:hypothetical protein